MAILCAATLAAALWSPDRAANPAAPESVICKTSDRSSRELEATTSGLTSCQAGIESEGVIEDDKPSFEMDTIKAARKEGLAAVSAVADISTLKEEAPIQTPKKSVTKKVTAKKGGKNTRRR